MTLKPLITLYTNHDLIHNSFLDVGLINANQSGKIDLKLKHNFFSSDPSLFVSKFTIKNREKGESIKVCVDFHDNANYFSNNSLKNCDYYFKVNFNKTKIEEVVQKPYSDKIKPFTPYFAVRPQNNPFRLYRIIGSTLERINYFRSKLLPYNIENLYFWYFNIFKINKLYARRLFENDYISDNLSRDFDVFFNPGCWPDTNEKFMKVNEYRATLIKQLKHDLGSKAYVGFVPNEIAKRVYPELCLDKELNHKEYISTIKKSKIAIYTNGVSDCISWKLGEYLAAGCCIIGEPLKNELFSHFIPEKNLLTFSSINEGVQKIKSFLNDKNTIEGCILNNINDYKLYFSPEASIDYILKTINS